MGEKFAFPGTAMAVAEAAEIGADAASANKGRMVPLASLAKDEEESVFAAAVPGFREDMLQDLDPEDLAACKRVLSHFLQCGAGASAQGTQKSGERESTHAAKKRGSGASAQSAVSTKKQKGSGASAQSAKKHKSAEASVEEAVLPKGWNMRYAAILARENWHDCAWPERMKQAHAVITDMSRDDVLATVPARLAEEVVARAHAPRPAWCSKCRNRGCAKCGPRD